MCRSRPVLLALCLCALLVALPASAQDNGKPVVVSFEGETGSIDIQHEVQTTAAVELTVGEQIYRLKVPVTIQIDTQSALTDATLAAPVAQQVGMILFEPTGREIIEGVYEKGQRSVKPSPGNVVVVYRAEITNGDTVPVDGNYTANLKTVAIDDVGSVYQAEERFCGNINPGTTVSCEFVFDVPTTANLVDLEVTAAARKRFAFKVTE